MKTLISELTAECERLKILANNISDKNESEMSLIVCGHINNMIIDIKKQYPQST